MGVSREDIICAYEMLLDRQPEGEEAILFYSSARDRRSLASMIMQSQEFFQKSEVFTSRCDQFYPGYTQDEIDVLKSFRPYDGPGRSGFVINFLGRLCRVAFSAPLKNFDGAVETYPLPQGGFQGETAEYIGTLRSVLAATSRYRMLELGAGYGPWMGLASAACAQRGISDVRLYGVEGDPGHFQFLHQHMADNGISHDRYVALQGAIGVEDGTAFWAIENDPSEVYGGRPMDGLRMDYHGIVHARTLEVPVFGINAILSHEAIWDLVHIDIQGGEGDVCRAGMSMMTEKVRRMVVGTHSRALDGEVMSLFHKAGWSLENEKPTISNWRDGAHSLETMARVDGVQVWRNGRLA